MAKDLPPGKFRHAGVDWITCTAATEQARNRLYFLGERLLHRNQQEGQDATSWRGNGYSGRLSGGTRVGVRPDSVILTLSSVEASEEWKHALSAAENCSRLDLAVDIEYELPVATLARDLYRGRMHKSSRNGRRCARSLTVSSDGGATVYFGKRVSENFGRVYDKGVEQQACEPGKWWRWEVELKGATAWHVSSQMKELETSAAFCRAFVHDWFRDRAPFCYRTTDAIKLCQLKPRASDRARQLEWLAKGVRPTVAKLVEWYGRDRVLHALGLSSTSEQYAASINASSTGARRWQPADSCIE